VTGGVRVVGGDHPIADAALKAAGRLAFATDLRLPGMLHAKLVLSPLAHARVRRIDVTKALALEGVVGVFTHEDSPATKYSRYRILADQDVVEDETLFASTVRFAGDRVAAVVAADAWTAAAAAELVEVEYEGLPPVLSADAALREGAPRIHSGGNLAHEFEVKNGVTPVARLDDVTVNARVSTPRIHHAALEPHACIASCDEEGGLTIWSATQSVFGARMVVAGLLGLDEAQVRVIKVPMGGSFGGKQEFILEPVTAFLARAVRRPVRLALDRQECIYASMVRGATSTRLGLTSGPDGVLRGIDADTLFDAGGYASSSPDYAEMMAHKLLRLYRVPTYTHRGRVAYTTTPVAGGARAYGAPEICAAMEISLDLLARELSADPVDLRLRNLVQPGDVDPLSGLSLGDARVRDCLERGAQMFRWSERVTGRPGSGRYRTGVGVACGAHKNGVLSRGYPDCSTMMLTLGANGRVSLVASLHEVGCGSLTAMRLIVAEELGIDPKKVEVCEADTDVTPWDFGCLGSRVTYVCGAAARHVARTLKQRLAERGGEVPPEGLTVEYRHDAAGNPGAYAVCFAEAVVDRWTGLARVTDLLAVGDVGQAINRQMVVGQFQGAAQMGIGFALCEEVALDDMGRQAPAGFKNYHVVNTPDMPDVKVLLVEHPGDDGPYGAKSVGEIATVPVAPAVVNAVNRALGTALTDLPLTPERILAALV
jgi:CO/xanthine dehydrogenase Mo-binding subunit